MPGNVMMGSGPMGGMNPGGMMGVPDGMVGGPPLGQQQQQLLPPPLQQQQMPIKQQPQSGNSTMEAQYMQQQSQIFVFSTNLANKAAEAVLQGQFQTIIAFHCSQPGTKKILEVIFRRQYFLCAITQLIIKSFLRRSIRPKIPIIGIRPIGCRCSSNSLLTCSRRRKECSLVLVVLQILTIVHLVCR